MKIAVTSQNFRTVTGHAGKARRFLVFEADGGEVREVERLDLPKEMSFHELQGDAPHPVDGVDVLVTGDPAVAVRLVSTGRPLPPPELHEHHGVVLGERP